MRNQGVALGFFCSLLLIPNTVCATGEQPQEETPLAEKVASSIKQISSEHSPSIVRIRCHDEHGEIVGTGFYIDPTGTIITLAEIVQDAQQITVEQPGSEQGKTLPATLVAIDPRSGVAFLKVSTTNESSSFLTPIPITNAPEMTPVIGIGYPQEQQATPVLGMITGSKTHDGETFFCVTHLTASIPLSEGEGGAPVLDLNGNLLGIVISGNTQLGTCTILPSAAIEQLHHNLMRYGGINPGWVGAMVEIAAVPQKNSTTRIVSVAPGSPAEKAGIQPGDTLLSLGSHTIQTPEDVLNASFYLSAGEQLQVSVARKDVVQSLTLQCGEHPSATLEMEAVNPAGPVSLLGESAH